MLDGHAPHDGHRIVADWQRRGLVDTIVTQNVDGFHTRAGATGVLELHGTLATVRCHRCGAEQPARAFLDADGTRCACGGKRRPGVVLFGEALPAAVLEAAWQAARRARLFVVLGSSLLVAPANLLPQAAAAAGAPLVIVNHDPTPLDGAAALVISAPIGQTLREVDALLAAEHRSLDDGVADDGRRPQPAVDPDVDGVERAGRQRDRDRVAADALAVHDGDALARPLDERVDLGAVQPRRETGASASRPATPRTPAAASPGNGRSTAMVR